MVVVAVVVVVVVAAAAVVVVVVIVTIIQRVTGEGLGGLAVGVRVYVSGGRAG